LELCLYRLPPSSSYDFEFEQPLPNGGCLIIQSSDNARITKLLEESGICNDRLQALDLINHGLET